MQPNGLEDQPITCLSEYHNDNYSVGKNIGLDKQKKKIIIIG
jgi:hypothetical protein